MSEMNEIFKRLLADWQRASAGMVNGDELQTRSPDEVAKSKVKSLVVKKDVELADESAGEE